MNTYQQYANQALQTSKQVANEFYEVGSQAAATAADEAYKLGVYASQRAGELSKRKLTIKQVLVALVGLGLLYLIIQEVRKSSTSSASADVVGAGGSDIPVETGNGGFLGGVVGGGGSSYDSVPNENKELKNGVKGVNVRQLQTLLNAQGQSLTVDGIFGRNTKSALIAVTGQDSTTLAEFKAGDWSSGSGSGGNNGGNSNTLNNSKTLKVGVRGEEVKKLQQGLNLQLSSSNRISEDGIFGNNTKNALQSVTGKTQITLTEWFAMQSSL